jgi:HEAT repeat protein
MVLDAKTSDMARYELERIPGAAANRVLRDALGKAAGKTRLGIINSLGVRGDRGSVTELRAFALGSSAEEAAAAQSALAQIADDAAVAVLKDAYGKNAGGNRRSAAEAYLQAADRLVQRGNSTAALPIYQTLYAAADLGSVRAAALRGLAVAGGVQANPALLEALYGADLSLQAVAVTALVPGSAGQLTSEMPKLSEAAQVRVLGLLSERGEASAMPAFSIGLKSTSKHVRLAALQGIGPIGDASAVPVVAAFAAGDDAGEQAAARAALARFPGKDVDQALAAGIASGPVRVRREMIRAAGERGAATAAPALLKTARDGDADVRRDSLKALANVGGRNEVSSLVGLVVTPVDPGDRAEAARSLGAVVRRSGSSQINEVLAAYTQATDLEVRAALMRVMGQSGSAEALASLRGALKGQDAAVERAAILALGEWPDATTVPDLLEVARSSANPAHQVLAVRGAVQLICLPNPSRPNQQSARLLADAMSLARQPAEKRAILALLPRYPVKESLDLAASLANDPEVAAEAKAAAARLERTVRR